MSQQFTIAIASFLPLGVSESVEFAFVDPDEVFVFGSSKEAVFVFEILIISGLVNTANF